MNDLNHDNQLDIVVANTETDSVGIFWGRENGTFQSQVIYSSGTGSQPYSVVVGDFDNDNQKDIIVSNHGSNSIGILIGLSNGTFGSVNLQTLGSSKPVMLLAAYLDYDTCLDLVLANYGADSISISYGYCNTSFSNQITYSTGFDSLPCDIVVADLDQDTFLDIIVANFGTNNIVVFMGYGNRMFADYKIYSTGLRSQPSAVAVGDFNSDNHLDIAVCNYGSSTFGMLSGYGNGTFGKIQMLHNWSGFRPQIMATEDFNQDNILDFVVADSASDYIEILIRARNGTVTGTSRYTIEFNSAPVFLVSGDFNNDNQSDLGSVNSNTNSIIIFLQYVKTFSDQVAYPTGPFTFPRSVTVGDLNNDGIIDFATANSNTYSIGLFLGDDIGNFFPEITLPLPGNFVPYSIISDDFNNDKLLDFVIVDYINNNMGIILGRGNSTFAIPKTYSTGGSSGPLFVISGDLNSDSRLDVVVVNNGAGSIGIWLGNGNGTFVAQMIFSTGNNSLPSSAVLCDMNNDNKLDIVVSNHGADNFGIFLGIGNGSFAEQKIFSTGVGTAPIAVAVSDFNNDTLYDVVVANDLGNSIAIFMAGLNGTFKMSTYYIGDGSRPSAVVLSDFNNDGSVDIVVTNFGRGSIVAFFGNGHGSFQMSIEYPTGDGSYPVSIKATDFNRDGWLDVVTSNREAHNAGVFLGYYATVVFWQQSYSTGTSSLSYFVVVSDFNNDTNADFAVVNSAYDNIGILLGDGNGTFSDEIMFSTITNSRPQVTSVGDINNDGQMDIALCNTMTDSVTIAFGCGNGTFINQKTYSTGENSSPSFTATGDFNKDGRLDLCVVNEGTSNVGILLSFDYATFKVSSTLNGDKFSIPKWIVLTDFNNDGLLDIAIANYASRNIGIFFGHGNLTFSEQKTYSTGNGASPYMIATNDFNNDAIMDIAIANYDGGNIGILLGYGNGSFAEANTYSTGTKSQPNTIDFGDFNNDSYLDMVVTNRGTNTVGILLGYGNGTFAEQKTMSTGSNTGPRAVAVGDMNDDNILDLIVANEAAHNAYLFIGYGNGTFTKPTTILQGNYSFPHSVVVGYFNKDSFLDFAIANRGNNNVGVLLGYGNGSFTSQVTYSTGYNSITLTLIVVDINYDNNSDIAAVNLGTDSVSIFFGYGDGSFTQQILFSAGAGYQPNGVAFADLNGDNQIDFAISNLLDGSATIFLRDGSQPFLTMATYSAGNNSHPKAMAVADLNNDTNLDIIVANHDDDSIGLFFGYGNGTFKNQEVYSIGKGSKPSSVTFGDFNNDRLLDIVVANAGTSNIGMFLGQANGTFSIFGLYSTGNDAIPHGLAVADFNKDNNLDLSVANSVGQNIIVLFGNGDGTFGSPVSYLLGFGSQPFSLATGDFNKDSWIDIVVADYNSNDVHILLQTCESNLTSPN